MGAERGVYASIVMTNGEEEIEYRACVHSFDDLEAFSSFKHELCSHTSYLERYPHQIWEQLSTHRWISHVWPEGYGTPRFSVYSVDGSGKRHPIRCLTQYHLIPREIKESVQKDYRVKF